MNSTKINLFLLRDPKASDAGTAEASNSRGTEACGVGKEPELSAEKTHKSYDLGPNKSTFLAGLSLMLELFNEGKSAEEIWILFNNINRPYSLSFIETVVNGDIPTPARDELSDAEQLEAEHQKHLAMTMFAQILRLNYQGRSVQFIKDKLEHHQHYSTANFIRELICYSRFQIDIIRLDIWFSLLFQIVRLFLLKIINQDSLHSWIIRGAFLLCINSR